MRGTDVDRRRRHQTTLCVSDTFKNHSSLVAGVNGVSIRVTHFVWSGSRGCSLARNTAEVCGIDAAA